MSGNTNQFAPVRSVSNASISHSAAAANHDATISAAVEDPDAPVSNPTTAASTSHSAVAENPDAPVSAAPVSNPTTAASTSHPAAAANPDAENPDSSVSNPTTTASTSHSAVGENPEAPIVFGVVAATPWRAMWSNEKPSAFETVDATVVPRKKLAWGVQGTNPASTSNSAAAVTPDGPESAAPVAFSQQHWPLTSHQQLPFNPPAFEAVLAAAPSRAKRSNEKPSALVRVEAAVAQRKKLARGLQATNPTTASASNSAAASNPDGPVTHPTPTASTSNSAAVAPVSNPTTTAWTSHSVAAAPVAFSQQHWPLPPPHQQLPFFLTAFDGALGAAPWPVIWSNEQPSVFERLGAAAVPRKKLAWGVQGTNVTEKSPGFRMRVDSDDGISDDEQGSVVAPGPVCQREHDQITCPLSTQPMKKKKREEPPKHTLSLDKLMEFVATWREPCLRHPDDSDTILGSMINSYAHTLSLNQRKRMKSCFTQYPAIALLNVAARIMGAPSLCPSLVPTVSVGMDAKPGRSNEGDNNPPDSSLSLSLWCSIY